MLADYRSPPTSYCISITASMLNLQNVYPQLQVQLQNSPCLKPGTLSDWHIQSKLLDGLEPPYSQNETIAKGLQPSLSQHPDTPNSVLGQNRRSWVKNQDPGNARNRLMHTGSWHTIPPHKKMLSVECFRSWVLIVYTRDQFSHNLHFCDLMPLIEKDRMQICGGCRNRHHVNSRKCGFSFHNCSFWPHFVLEHRSWIKCSSIWKMDLVAKFENNGTLV